jgi:hypothetical protein
MTFYTETWGLGNGSDWTVAQGADYNWTMVNGTYEPSLTIVNGVGRIIPSTVGTEIGKGVHVLDGVLASDVDITFDYIGNDSTTSLMALIRHVDGVGGYFIGYGRGNLRSFWSSNSDRRLFIGKSTEYGSLTLLASTVVSFLTPGTIRARVVGDTLSIKRWTTGQTEPVDWLHTITDLDYVGPGRIGLGYSGTPSVNLDLNSFSAEVLDSAAPPGNTLLPGFYVAKPGGPREWTPA